MKVEVRLFFITIRTLRRLHTVTVDTARIFPDFSAPTLWSPSGVGLSGTRIGTIINYDSGTVIK
jgi:hypothetical protein